MTQNSKVTHESVNWCKLIDRHFCIQSGKNLSFNKKILGADATIAPRICAPLASNIQ
jgi:hypothetical protein